MSICPIIESVTDCMCSLGVDFQANQCGRRFRNDGFQSERQIAALDWLVRDQAPIWLDASDIPDQAEKLRLLGELQADGLWWKHVPALADCYRIVKASKKNLDSRVVSGVWENIANGVCVMEKAALVTDPFANVCRVAAGKIPELVQDIFLAEVHESLRRLLSRVAKIGVQPNE